MNTYEAMREKFGAKGYKVNKQKPLADKQCYLLSIYYANKHGDLYTTSPPDGEPYIIVREGNDKLPKDMWICVHCKKAFKSYELATKHYEN